MCIHGYTFHTISQLVRLPESGELSSFAAMRTIKSYPIVLYNYLQLIRATLQHGLVQINWPD